MFFSVSAPLSGEAFTLLDLDFVGLFDELPYAFPFFVGECVKAFCFLVEALIVSLLLIELGLSSLILFGELRIPLSSPILS